MENINKILKDYTAGGKTLEDTNAALAEAGAGFHLEPGRNEITDEDRKQTVVGYYPEQATGLGLLDTGTGSMEKVCVYHGRLEHPVNEVQPDGSTNMAAYVIICGRVYEVFGDTLREPAKEEAPAVQKVPRTPDMRRRTDLAGQTVRQHTRAGDFEVHYDELGYAVRARRAGWKPEEDRGGEEPTE